MRALLIVERDAAPPRGFATRSGAALGIILFGTTAEARGAAAGLRQERPGNARLDQSQEAWPGAEPAGKLAGESRSVAPEGERAPMQGGNFVRAARFRPPPNPPPQGGRETE